MKKSRLMILALVLTLTMLTSATVVQAMSDKLALDATLADPTTGGAFPSGRYTAKFEIFTVSSGGTALWTETKGVTVSSTGTLFTVLGSLVPLPYAVLRPDVPKSPSTLNVFASEIRWLQITLSSTTLPATVLTRKKINTAAYAANADRLDGLDSTAFALSTHTHSAAELTSGSMTGSSTGNLFRVYNSGTGNGVYGESKDGVGVRAYSVTDYGIIGEGGGTAGVMARHLTSGNWVDNARSDFALKAYASASATGGGHGIEASSQKGDGLRSFAYAADKSSLYGVASGTNGYGAYLASTKGQGIAVWSTSGAHDGVGSNTNGSSKSAYYGYASGSNGYGAFLVSDAANGTGIYARGGTTGWAATFRGNVRILDRATGSTVMELGKGLDYAEGFNVTTRSKIIPGSVVVIDPQHPGKLSLSSAAYDSKVAGIVAGANGLGSGVRLGAGEFDLDVALAGRVYCMVDASRGEIRPGDLLTTSAIPGHAMKARDYKRAQGAILGKAMQGLKKGEKGQILVLVTLQ
ncbi:MAG: hypothetical protein AB9866_21360 [Syntrophobacteraceae bacterium]